MSLCLPSSFFFFFNDTATTEIYTLSLHDALPILQTDRGPARRRLGAVARRPRQRALRARGQPQRPPPARPLRRQREPHRRDQDRKSTRLNSSHLVISYAVFCLKKKNKQLYCESEH